MHNWRWNFIKEIIKRPKPSDMCQDDVQRSEMLTLNQWEEIRLCGSSLSETMQRCSSWPVTGLTRHVVTRWLILLILEEKIDNASFLRAASVLSRDGRTRKVDVSVLTSEKRVDLNFITHLGTGRATGEAVTVEHQALAQLTRPERRVPSYSGFCARFAEFTVIGQRLDTVSIGFFCEV